MISLNARAVQTVLSLLIRAVLIKQRPDASGCRYFFKLKFCLRFTGAFLAALLPIFTTLAEPLCPL